MISFGRMTRFLVALALALSIQRLEGAVLPEKRVEKTFVESFIKFRSVQEPGQSFASIEPIGCSPTNNDADAYIQPNETVVLHDFQYLCHKDEHGNLDFEAVRCIDPFGEKMRHNEQRLLSNGTTVLYCKVQGMTLKKVYERASGCRFNGTVYSDEETWVERGAVKRCFNVRFSFHEVHTIGCEINSTQVLFGEVHESEDGKYYKCKDDGAVAEVSVDGLGCERADGKVAAHNSTYQEDDSVFQCSMGKIEKTACIVNGELLPIGRVATFSDGSFGSCMSSGTIRVTEKVPEDVKIVEISERRIPITKDLKMSIESFLEGN